MNKKRQNTVQLYARVCYRTGSIIKKKKNGKNKLIEYTVKCGIGQPIAIALSIYRAAADEGGPANQIPG